MNSFKLDLPTKIYFGEQEFLRIKTVLKNYLNKKALIVIGLGSIKKLKYLEKLTLILDALKIKYVIFEGIEPNPRHRTINTASNFAREEKVDFIIAFGGGSVMDASKGIAISTVSGEDIWKYCNIQNNKVLNVSDALPLICIPTLAATGSEVNSGAVISNIETKQKAVIHSSKIYPKYAIIDPEFLKTVPLNYTIDGAIDIIVHSLETFLSTELELYPQDYFSYSISKAVKKAIDNVLLNKKTDREDAKTLSWSSCLTMSGFLSGRNSSWPIHEIEHGISAVYDVSHGLGLSYVLINVLNFNINNSSNIYKNKINKFIGFFLHDNSYFYKDINTSFNDFKNYVLNLVSNRADSFIFNFNKNLVAESILSTYGNGNFISNLKNLYYEDMINILSFNE